MIFELQGGRDRGGRAGGVLLDATPSCGSSAASTSSLVGPERLGQDDADRDARRHAGELAAGKLSTGHNVKVGYLSQHAEELGAGGDPSQSVLDAAQRATELTPNKARALLGRFLFSGEEAEKPLAGLSGGERRRLSLAILVHSGANVLILDEPTNHLDIESREALEDALRAFPGAVLLVSHDRALLDAVGTRTVAVEDGSLRSYEGGWAEYVRVREETVELSCRLAGGAHARPGGAAHAPLRQRVAATAGTTSARERERARARRPRTKPKAEGALEEPALAPSRRPSGRSKRPRPRWPRSSRSWPTRRRGRRKYESAKSEARHTAARSAPSRPPTRELEALLD